MGAIHGVYFPHPRAPLDLTRNPEDPLAGCDDCEDGFYGANCTACPVCNSVATDAGACVDGIEGDGSCVCGDGYYGPLCEGVCPTLSSRNGACNGRGKCDDGADGSGACHCDEGWLGKMCHLECLPSADNVCSGHGKCVLRLSQTSLEVWRDLRREIQGFAGFGGGEGGMGARQVFSRGGRRLVGRLKDRARRLAGSIFADSTTLGA